MVPGAGPRRGSWVRHDPFPGATLSSIGARTPKDVWVGTEVDVRHWDGETWTQHVLPNPYLVHVYQLPLRPYIIDLAQVGDTTEMFGAGYVSKDGTPVIDRFS